MKRKKFMRLGNDDQVFRYYSYNLHYACFACRKMFNRPGQMRRLDHSGAAQNVIPCPDCRTPMNNMGKEFKTPRRNNLREWRKIEMLYRRGFRWETKFTYVWTTQRNHKIGYRVPISRSPRARTLRDARTDYPPSDPATD